MLLALACFAQGARPPPHIFTILADDCKGILESITLDKPFPHYNLTSSFLFFLFGGKVGWWDTQVHNPVSPTPTIGAMVQEGIVLERAYAFR